MALFGKGIIGVRLFNAGMIYLSVFLPLMSIKEAEYRRRYLFISSIILILITPLNANILGYDTISVFLISLIYTISIQFVKYEKLKHLFLLAFLTSISVFVRLPNLILLPIIFFFLYLQKGLSWKRFKIPITYLFLTLFILLLGYSALYLNFNFSLDILGGSHDPFQLFRNYWSQIPFLLLVCTFILIIFFSILYVSRLRERKWNGIGLFILIILLAVFIYVFLLHTKYGVGYSFYLFGILFTIIATNLYDPLRDQNYKQRLISLLLIALVFVIPFGSNTGFLKISLLFVIIPFAIIRSQFYSAISLLLLLSLPFSFVENMDNYYEDQSMVKLDKSLNIKELTGIYTNQTRSEFVENIAEEVKILEENKVEIFFYGNKSHLFTYLYPEKGLTYNFYQEPGQFFKDYSYLRNGDRIAVFYIDLYPTQQNIIKESEMALIFKSEGFKKINKNGFYYFYK